MLIKSYEKVIIDTSSCCIFILIRFIYKSLHRLLRANEAIFFLPISPFLGCNGTLLRPQCTKISVQNNGCYHHNVND